MPKPILAITLGDPGGIGPEVIAKALQTIPLSKKLYYVVLGIPQAFKRSFHPIPTMDKKWMKQDAINFFDVSEEAQKILSKTNDSKSGFRVGKVSKNNAAIAFAALKIAAHQAAAGHMDAIVTAPVNKTSMRLIDPNFHGHTEYLAKAARVKKFAMMFVGNRLKVTLVTIHVPVKKVSGLIKQKKVFEKIQLTYQFLRDRMGIKSPRIAVCALNPHGKETGREDDAQILPAVLQARKQKMNVVGPLSADQLFHDAYEGRYDAVISMYHDQGLAPFKMISFRDGVNVTLGLPFVRTSPDHGTAFDIAGKNKADASSMIASIRLAEKLLHVHAN